MNKIIVKGIEIPNEITTYLKAAVKKMNEYDDLLYSVNWLLKKKKFANLYAVMKSNKICDLIYSDRTYGIKFLTPYFFGDITYTIKAIKKYFKGGILVDADGIDAEKYGLHYCDMTSSFNKECEYISDSGSRTPCVLNRDDMRILAEAMEKDFFPELGEITFDVYEGEEANQQLKYGTTRYPFWNEKFRSVVTVGFHYLCPDITSSNKLLVARTGNRLVGAIKWGCYYRETPKYTHYGLNFIDVAVPYRNKGISKMLIHELAKHIDNKYPLVLSYESEMGEKCRMEEHFLAETWKTPIYTSKQWDERRYV